MSNADQYKVIENPNYGLPLEPRYLVEDSSIMYPLIKQIIITPKRRSGVNKPPQIIFVKTGELRPVLWSVPLLQKQINNLNIMKQQQGVNFKFEERLLYLQNQLIIMNNLINEYKK